MIAGCSPRMIFSHKKRLIEPNLPKYMPFKQLDHFLVLEFDIPTQFSLSPLPTSTTTQPTAQPIPSFSLQASSSCLPFAGLTFKQSLLPSPQPYADVVSNTSAVVTVASGGADSHLVAVSADDIMTLGMNDQAVASTLATCGGDLELDDVAKTDLFTSDVLNSSHGEPFAFEDTGTSFALQVCASSLSYTNHYSPCFHYSLLPFSYNNCSILSFTLSPPFLNLFSSSLTSIPQLHFTFPPQPFGVPSHCQPNPSQSTAYLTSFNAIQQPPIIRATTMATVEGHRCADVVMNRANAPASIALHWGAYDQSLRKGVAIDVDLNGTRNAEDRAIWVVINMCRCGGDPNNRIALDSPLSSFDSDFEACVLRVSAPSTHTRCFNSGSALSLVTSILIFDTAYLPSPYSPLSFSHNNFPFRSFTSTTPPFSTFSLFAISFVSSHFETSPLLIIISSADFSRPTPSRLHSEPSTRFAISLHAPASEFTSVFGLPAKKELEHDIANMIVTKSACDIDIMSALVLSGHCVAWYASGGSIISILSLPFPFQTIPGIPYKMPVVTSLAHCHAGAVLVTNWSPHNNLDSLVASGFRR